MSDVESGIVKERMQALLSDAMKHGCSPEGHSALVQLMAINGTLLIDTRDGVKETQSQVAQINGTLTKMYKDSHATSLFFGKKWANPVKMSALGLALAGAFSELLQRVLEALSSAPPKVGP